MIDKLQRLGCLPWQRKDWARIYTLIDTNRLPHALLLYGKRGIGKSIFSDSIIELLFCESPREQKACYHCKPCLLKQSKNHSDLYVIRSEEEGKPILVDSIRELVIGVNKGSSPIYTKALHHGWKGNWKVVVIEGAEAMNVNAANALLKILEEPPKNTLFILITDYLQQIFPTIRSRCHKMVVSTPTPEETKDWLLNDTDEMSEVLKKTIGLLYPTQPILVKKYWDLNLIDLRIKIHNYCEKGSSTLNEAFDLAEYIVANDKYRLAIDWFYEDVVHIFKTNLNKYSRTKIGDLQIILEQSIREKHTNTNAVLMWKNLLTSWFDLNQSLIKL